MTKKAKNTPKKRKSSRLEDKLKRILDNHAECIKQSQDIIAKMDLRIKKIEALFRYGVLK